MTLLFSYIIEVIKMIYEITKHKIKWVKIITVVIVIAIILKIGYIQIVDRVNIYNKAIKY